MWYALLAFSTICALAALVISLYCLRRAERPLLYQAMIEISDLQRAVESLLVRKRAAASSENAAKAREVRAEGKSLVDEAKEILEGKQPGAPLTLAKPLQGDSLIADLRRRAGIA